MYTTLISPTELHSQSSSCVVIDCRFDLADTEAGQRAYLVAHIPQARYAHLDRDLSGPKTAQTGRHPLPESSALARSFGQWGIGADTQVVAYDSDNGMVAARLWWLLRWLGHERVAVVDGGFKAWQAAGFPTTAELPRVTSTIFLARPRNDMVVSASDVAQLVTRTDWRLLDARAPERFRGDVEPIDPIAGHVPGARNHPFAWNLTPNGSFLSTGVLKGKFLNSLDGVRSEQSAVMCGSGVTACQNLLALEVAGLKGAKLYAGSWSEWIRNPARPTQKGESR
jgi:thiosulfate/3-mercaptopyruvate sulfurtransferase